MSIHIGCELVAENGFHMLRKGELYYFLHSNPDTQKVWLVNFVITTPAPKTTEQRRRKQSSIKPILITIQRAAFELGISSEAIKKTSNSRAMPLWLSPLAGRNLVEADALRKSKKRSHIELVNARYRHILPLLERVSDVLASADPDQELNSHARQCVPAQKESRIRLWFYTFLLFGRNKLVLHYSICGIGRWSRTDVPRMKQGAPSKYHGKGHGYHTDAPMREKILASYARQANLGKSMVDMYREAMDVDFGCNIHKDKHGLNYYVQPDGLPFPGKTAFRYHINKSLGVAAVRQKKIGANREHTENEPSRGKFSAAVANLMEKVEYDGFHIKELPRGYVDSSPLPPLCMIAQRDTTSGIIAGIGFSQGSETARAYRLSNFCAAIDKVIWCRLHGVTIKPDDWPSVGISAYTITDRGPGTGHAAQPFGEGAVPVFQGLSVAHSGQSKAVIESSHPKKSRNEEAPSYEASNLTPNELCVRAIFQVLRSNDSINIQDRVPVDLIPYVKYETAGLRRHDPCRRNPVRRIGRDLDESYCRNWRIAGTGRRTRHGQRAIHQNVHRARRSYWFLVNLFRVTIGSACG